MVAKPGLMITHLGRKHEVLGLREFEFKMHLDIPASKFLPEGESSISSVVHDLNNVIKLLENQKLVAWTDI